MFDASTFVAIVDRDSGEPVSFGSGPVSPLPAHLEAVVIPSDAAEEMLAGAARWDAITRTVEPVERPPVPVPSASQIRNALVARGWPDDAVDALFREADEYE